MPKVLTPDPMVYLVNPSFKYPFTYQDPVILSLIEATQSGSLFYSPCFMSPPSANSHWTCDFLAHFYLYHLNIMDSGSNSDSVGPRDSSHYFLRCLSVLAPSTCLFGMSLMISMILYSQLQHYRPNTESALLCSFRSRVSVRNQNAFVEMAQ